MDSTSTFSKRIALTGCDNWLGCCTACHLAQELEKKCKDVQLVCLTRKPEKLERLGKYKNVRIEEVDYDDEKTIEKAIRGVRCTILIAEMNERRVKQANNVLTAMKNQSVRSCMMISVEGAGESSHLKELHSFGEIENTVKECCDEHLILRKSILNQCFLFWSPIVQEKCEFPTLTTKQCEMTPLDICDLVCAVEKIVIDHCHGQLSEDLGGFDHHTNKTYTLTGPEKINFEQLAREIGEITGEEIEVKEVSREELKRYLEKLKHRDHWDEEIYVMQCQDLLGGSVHVEGGDHRGDHDGGNPHYAPNESTTNLLLDELELIKRGEANFVSGDLEKIIGHQGKLIKDFLRKEKNAFKPHRD
ncbi:hypothetical protein BC939DRAFT_401802 [Gamsiella multidivaricata]|uniref:uncharacterized protein n=1 Tax=Gamsiella multidivaricata TaxID=101098 RepID=UPI00221F3D0D|nr:uncharacterized protein BC939DRAFT_401802 [Gamsiella multidivaricata]KAI7818155.1 hypothetical protein BC939DRAFT_401802 [Gamsiella multidivaricata]